MSCCSAFMSRLLLEQKGSSRRPRGRPSSCGALHPGAHPASVQFYRTKIWSYWTVVDVRFRRMLMTTPVTAQGPAVQGMSTQQGYAPGFPPPLGIEQYLGQPQQYGGFPQSWGAPQQFMGGFPQPYGGTPQQSYMQPQFPGQQLLSGQQLPIQQIVQALVSQLLPIAQQVILPQVVATATQQIPQHLQQLVSQQLSQQAGWQQPQFGLQGQNPFGGPFPGSF